ncbi:MAG: glucans biosynthesis glucosyltransferase MdoH, partial [Brevundimonas sp.]
MNKLAIRPVERADIQNLSPAPREPDWSWLPEEAPLAMPRQSLDAAVAARDVTPATSPRTVLMRRLTLLAGTVALAGLSAIAPFYLYARKGWDPTEMLAFGIFMVLITAISCWFVSGLMGLIVMLRGRDQADLRFAAHPGSPRTRTALLMPLYNEDARASFARLAQIDASLARLGASSAFDIFVLSDSTKDEAAADERSVFQAFRLAANSKAYYRRRTDNAERKAGNLAEWVRRFGGAYETMIVLDADSTMAGETLLRMIDAMERNPGVGLIQTAPVIVKARTVFARVSQYSVRLYGRVAAAGLAYWTGSESSYWGHNAIIRTRAFAGCCGLPSLPGRKPFGGHILSHDVVEAALLRRAGWAVHVTAALDGSWEETPPSITDFIRRDHRWFQGNLQHLGLIGAKGLSAMSRLQLLMGCMAYLSSPLWLASLMVGLFIQMFYPVDWASFFYILNPQFTPF